MHEKKFDEWNRVKQKVNDNKTYMTIHEGDVRWITFGINVGSEVDGKGDSFVRPAVVINVIGYRLALVVPLTSQPKNPPFFEPIEIEGRINWLCLHQIKVISQNRILRRIERISDGRLAKVRAAVLSFHHLTLPAMAHIHELVDFTVTCFILHPTEPKTLLIDHKALNTWLPVGGHVELNEDTDQALAREVQEECGLPIQMISEKFPGEFEGTTMLLRPEIVDVHELPGGHRHVNFAYFARALSADPVLAPAEHHDIRWFSLEDLRDPQLNIKPGIRANTIAFLEKFTK